MYRHARVTRIMTNAEGVLRDLFQIYLRRPEELPAERRQELASDDGGRGARQIANFIAGMTDRYALIEHAGSLTRPRNCVRALTVLPAVLDSREGPGCQRRQLLYGPTTCCRMWISRIMVFRGLATTREHLPVRPPQGPLVPLPRGRGTPYDGWYLHTGDLNIFETVLTRVKAACDAYAAAGGMPSGHRLQPASLSSRRVIPLTATWPPTPRWCSPRMPVSRRASSRTHWSKRCAPTIWSRKRKSLDPVLSISTLKPIGMDRRVARGYQRGRRLRPQQSWRRSADQCRIRFSQPDRADARRPHARRGVRRCAWRICWRFRAMP